MTAKKVAPIIPTIGIVVFRGSEVLLVKHTGHAGHLKDTYGIPAGRIDVGKNGDLEQAIKAAKRELEEETGYLADETDLVEFDNNFFVADIRRSDGTTKRMSWIVFLAKKVKGNLRASGETIPEWVRVSDLKNYNLVPNVKNAVDNARLFLQKIK